MERCHSGSQGHHSAFKMVKSRDEHNVETERKFIHIIIEQRSEKVREGIFLMAEESLRAATENSA